MEEASADLGSNSLPSLSDLMRQHRSDLFGIAFNILRDRDLAEDAVQEAFSAFWRCYVVGDLTFDPERGSVFALLKTITRNKAINIVRYRNVREVVTKDPFEGSSVVGPEEAIVARYDLLRALQKESPLYYREVEVIALHDLCGWTMTEIAAQLGEPLSTIKHRLYGARRRLRRSNFLRGHVSEPSLRERALSIR